MSPIVSESLPALSAVHDEAFDRRVERSLPESGRRALGQHFTSPAAVDLVCALALPRLGMRVLDPAAGAGAFLAGAARRAGHLGGRCAALVGVEVDVRAAAAAAERLSALSAEAPAELVRGDFADPSIRIPGGPFDAVIGNPPYVRQEAIGPERKAALAAAARRAWSDPGREIDGRSDLHVYFWFLAAAQLARGGRIAFLTSSAWLDAAYGGPLQELLLGRFAVEWVAESAAEPWFDAARVRTAVVVAREEPDREARSAQRVRFVRFDRPLAELLPAPDGDAPLRRVDAADRLLTELAGGRSPRGVAVRVVPQSGLSAGEGRFRGGKWGGVLRAPDLQDTLRRDLGAAAVPLGWLADLRFGLKSGADAFFFVRDLGPEPAGPGLRLVRAGDGTFHPIEARCLVPLVFSLMELDRARAGGETPRRALVLPSEEPLPPEVARYVAWGEASPRRFHLRPSCRSRPAWYALRPARAGQVLWPKIQQYRHVVPWNPLGLTASCNFYDLAPRDGRDPLLLAAVLNAFPQVLAKQAAGRVRNEGVLKTEVADAARMWAVDPARFAPAGGERVRQAFLALLARAALPVPEECGREDRCELDRAVLVAAGIGEGRASELVDRLHEHLCESFLRERRLERRAVEARRGPAVRIGPSPGDEASSGAQGALVPEVG